MTRRCYAVLASVSRSYSPLKGRLVTCYSPVRHFTQGLLPFLVRLACVRHAASVDSEPGSNSRLKPDVGLGRPTTSAPLRDRGLSCEYVQTLSPNITYHNWHVQPFVKDRSAFRLSGAPSVRTNPRRDFVRPRNLFTLSPHRSAVNLLKSQDFHLISTERGGLIQVLQP